MTRGLALDTAGLRAVAGRAVELRERWDRTVAVLRAPRVQIEMYGDAYARLVYDTFTARHPRFRVTSLKRWGVALVPLTKPFETYLGGASMTALRRKRRLAQKRGFRYGIVSPSEHLDAILEINRSTPVRQGRPMAPELMDRDHLERTFRDRPAIHGVLDADGRLRAYTLVPVVGDVCIFSIILGHADDLEHGTMYLLVSEVIGAFIDVRREQGAPSWAMYDTFWGAGQGLAWFKRRLGFEPYTVDWAWVEHADPPGVS